MKKTVVVLTGLALGASFCAFAGEVVTPNDFTGSDSERIEQAIAEAVKSGKNRMTIPREDTVAGKTVWTLDRAIVLPSRFTLLLDAAEVRMKPGVKDDLIRNAAADRPGAASDLLQEVLGLGPRKSVLRGGTVGIRLRNANGFIVSNLDLGETTAQAVLLDGNCQSGRVSNIRFQNPSRTRGGVELRGDCHDMELAKYYAAKRGAYVTVARTAYAINQHDIYPDDLVPKGAVKIPVLMPAPRELKAMTDAFIAPSPYVTRDWIAFSRDAKLPAEGYRLSVTPTGVTVAAADAAGEIHAMATLKQLGGEKISYRNCDTYDGGDWGRPLVIPCCEITDWPQYRWRGMLIDECRHFMGKETLKHVLDQMAYHKFNVLHWHLTEDQGWRIALDKFPKLVEYGAVRPSSPVHFDHAKVQNGEKYGPFFYTKDEIREIVAYAAERGITVVPEVEFPGHVRALLAGYPEYSCQGATLPRVPRCTWGIEDDVLCVGNDEALRFIEQILDEVVPLFPGEFFHIGGDECPTKRWKTCPKCIARAKELGLAGPEKLQGWITKRFTEYLNRKGKRVIGWDEILECEIPTASGIMSWRGFEGGTKGAKLGHDVVMCPTSHCYFNRMPGLRDDPFNARNAVQVLSLEKVYSFDPVAGIPENCRARILGSQACFWSEVIWNRYDLDWRMWPRACALAEVLWTAPERRDFAAFKGRMEEHRHTLIQRGVNCSPLE